jgi:RHS repeat-associated protein
LPGRYINAGTLYNNGWKSWRSYVQIPYPELAGKYVTYANIHASYASVAGNYTGSRYFSLGHANCIGWNCLGTQLGTALTSGDFDINITERLRANVTNQDYYAVWSIWGEEGAYASFKTYQNLYMYVEYDTPTPQTAPVEPADKQIVVHTQPSLRVNPITDADGGTVQYYFRVSTNPDAETGAVINSGWINSTQWTVPDGILQDGTTYYWHVYTYGQRQTNPNWVRSFRVDLRSGKDSTQSYDTVGPVGVDLATGSASMSTSTHGISALGGSIGVGLSYNSPAKSQRGLTGEYWNLSASYPFASGAPTTTPKLIRNDPNINFDWSTGTPDPSINSDWFYVRWKGFFVAPVAGTYYFGSTVDDAVAVYVDGQKVYGRGCCGGPDYTGSVPVTLSAGQVVSFRAEYEDATYAAVARIYVKGAVPEQIVPMDWLRSEVKLAKPQYGLLGRYYTDTGAHTFPANNEDPMRFMMARQDTQLNFLWGNGGPAPGLQADNFMARWTGYITVPTTGSYTFGAYSDNGIKVKLNNGLAGAENTILNVWTTQAGLNWGAPTTLTAGQAVPITIEYYEQDGGAAMQFVMKDAAGNQVNVPPTWLTPKANALPDGWQIGIDVDGNVAYERLRVSGSSAILEDSTRSTHEYKWTGTGYKPPVNEDGVLVKNSDNTFTFTDTDGRIYVFNTNGSLKSVTSPTDDRQPAAIKYEYGGDPSRLLKITDGVTSTRYGTLHYKSVNEDGNCSVPSGFDAAPDGMLCAFKTSDGDITKLYYKNGYLSRVELPGNQITDYGYDAFGRIVTTRDSAVNDVVAAGLRTAGDVITDVSYDDIGRVRSVIAPAAMSGGARIEHKISYLPGATQMSIVGASEPMGYSKRIEYDSLLRTTKATDLTGKSTLQEWDPVKDLLLSATDPTGLKSTTIYDADDRPIESYGPAPSTWFGTDRKPVPAQLANVPKASSAYDEGLVGPSVSWYDVKGSTLVGSPRYTTTGVSGTNPGILWRDSTVVPQPVSRTAGMDGIGFKASGKLSVATTGTYTVTVNHDDAFRLWIDDKLIIDRWSNRVDSVSNVTGQVTLAANTSYRFSFEYADYGTARSAFSVDLLLGTNNQTPSSNWSSILKPGYNLATSQTAYDSVAGDVTTKTVYKDPAYGQVEKTVLDPTGLNYEAKAEYEAPGTALLRQTSKTLPGGAKTTYQHYGREDTMDNPCTAAVEAYHQAGRPKGKVEPDPDGAGPLADRSSETIYNESGDVVATRYNSDPWTCTTYDARGRVTETNVPARTENGVTISGRTITNDYSVGGNPLITATTDPSGTITVENDLLGRTIKYTDAKGNITTNAYDQFGKLTSRTSPIGTEEYAYDAYDRLITHKLDGVTYATVTYDEFSRIANVQYPAGLSLTSLERDSFGRLKKSTYNASGTLITDEVTRSVQGRIMSGVENGVSKAYTYDKASRLLSATIGSDTYSYEFGLQDPSCTSLPGYNANANKDSNRTKLTINGQTTTYCYDQADRLIKSSDARFTDPVYDSHGNTISLGDVTHKTEFTYDSADRNVGIKQTNTVGTQFTTYTRDVSDRILTRTFTGTDTQIDANEYGFTGSGDTPDFQKDSNGTITQKYLGLPGGVTLTLKPQSTSAGTQTYSLSSIHGDTLATVNADGLATIVAPTGPFGERSSTNQAQTIANTTDRTQWGYVGRFQKSTETSFDALFIQMGARVYAPELGRFLQVDPVEGGTLNNYVYAMDPVNDKDIDGRMAQAVALALGPWGIAAFIVASIAIILVTPKPNVNIKISVPNISLPRADTKAGSIAKSLPQKPCLTYAPAPPPYKGTTYAPASNPKAPWINASINSVQTQLQLGINPGGFNIIGYGTNKPFTIDSGLYSPPWRKQSIPYLVGEYEVHYNINDATCQYADLKYKNKLFGM